MTSTIFLGIAALALALLFRAQTSTFPLVAQRLPMLLIWVVIGLAVLMIAEAFYLRYKGRRPAENAAAPIKWPVLLSFGGATVAYVALIPIAGYLIATPLFVGGVLVASRNTRPLTTVLLALGTTGFMWAIFIWALNLPVKLLPFSN